MSLFVLLNALMWIAAGCWLMTGMLGLWGRCKIIRICQVVSGGLLMWDVTSSIYTMSILMQ